MLVMVVFFIAFRWIHLSTPLIRLFLLVLILLLMPTLNFLPVWFALSLLRFLFFQAEDGIRDLTVTGVQTCALPIFPLAAPRISLVALDHDRVRGRAKRARGSERARSHRRRPRIPRRHRRHRRRCAAATQIGRASCRGRV